MRIAILLLSLLALCLAAPQSTDQDTLSPTLEPTPGTEITPRRRSQFRSKLNRRFNAERRQNILKTTTTTTTTTPKAKPVRQRKPSLGKRQRPNHLRNRFKSTTTTVEPLEPETQPEGTDPSLDIESTDTTIITEEITQPSTTAAPTKKPTPRGGGKFNTRGRGRGRGRGRKQEDSFASEDIVLLDVAFQSENKPSPTVRTRGNHRFRPLPQRNPKIIPAVITNTRSRLNPDISAVDPKTIELSGRQQRRGGRKRTSRVKTQKVTTEKPVEISTIEAMMHKEMEKISMKFSTTQGNTFEESITTLEPEILTEPEPEPDTISSDVSNNNEMLKENEPTIQTLINFEDEEIKEKPLSRLMPKLSSSQPIRKPNQLDIENILQPELPFLHKNAVQQPEIPHRFSTGRKLINVTPTRRANVRTTHVPAQDRQPSLNEVTSDNEVQGSSSARRFSSRNQRFQHRVNPGIIQPAAHQPAREPEEIEALEALDFGSEFSTETPLKFRPLVVRSRSDDVTTFRPPHNLKDLIQGLPKAHEDIPGIITQEVHETTHNIKVDEHVKPETKHIVELQQESQNSRIPNSPKSEEPTTEKSYLPTKSHELQFEEHNGVTEKSLSRQSNKESVSPDTEVNKQANNNPTPRRGRVIKNNAQRNTRGRKTPQTQNIASVPRQGRVVNSNPQRNSRGRPIANRNTKPIISNKRLSSRRNNRINSKLFATTSAPIVNNVTPSPHFAPPLSDAVLSTIHETSHKFMLPRVEYGISDIRYRGNEVIITEVGTVEDTPAHEVKEILSGLGGRRRGLSRNRSPLRTTTTTAEPAPLDDSLLDYLYDYDTDYVYVYEDGTPV